MNMYKKFSKLLETYGVTPYRVHKATGISTATLSDWKNGKSEPKRDKIQKICDFFNVPVSYFYEDEARNPESSHNTLKSSYENYRKLRDSRGLNDSRVAKEAGVSRSTFSDWKNGRSTPKQPKLQKIADYLGVSLEYLINGNDPKDDDKVSDKDIQALIRLAEQKPKYKKAVDLIVRSDEKDIDFAIELLERTLRGK